MCNTVQVAFGTGSRHHHADAAGAVRLLHILLRSALRMHRKRGYVREHRTAHCKCDEGRQWFRELHTAFQPSIQDWYVSTDCNTCTETEDLSSCTRSRGFCKSLNHRNQGTNESDFLVSDTILQVCFHHLDVQYGMAECLCHDINAPDAEYFSTNAAFVPLCVLCVSAGFRTPSKTASSFPTSDRNLLSFCN